MPSFMPFLLFTVYSAPITAEQAVLNALIEAPSKQALGKPVS